MADFATFSSQFKGDLVTPEHDHYKEAIARWAVNAERKAKVVAFVKNEQDIGLAIAYAKSNGLPIAIRGGGHSASGASSSEGGLVIDLSRYLNGARADAEKKLVYVGGGALWETVDKEAIAHGLATVAGTVNHTGVGGLLLGGGYGWLSPQYGLVLDNLVQATVVIADGSVLTASDTENPDLFFGIRGGGSNFGVATNFVLKLYPQRRTVYAGHLIFKPTDLETVVAVTTDWYDNAGEKECMLQMNTIGPDGNPAIVMSVFYNGSETEGREKYKAFLDIGPVVDATREMPYEEVNALQNAMAFHGQGIYQKGLAQRKPDFKSISKAFDKVIELHKNGLRSTIFYEYFPLAKINSVPSDATAFRRDPTPVICLGFFWKATDTDKTPVARAGANEISEILAAGQTDLSASEILGYGNYDPEGVSGEPEEVPDKAKLVFRENYPRLQQVKKKYDPENIFNKWFAITPA